MTVVSCKKRVDSRCFGASERHTLQDLFDVHRQETRGQTTSKHRRAGHFPHPLKAIDHRQKRFAWTLFSIR